MIIQILPDSWILRVACNTVDPYTLPASHHIFFRSNGIIKCDRNIKYSRGGLGFKFWNSRGLWRAPPRATSRTVHVRLIEILVLDIQNAVFIGWTVIFTMNPDDILSLTQPQISATWRPWRFAFKWPLILRFLSALCLVDYRWPIHPSNIKFIFSSRSTA